MTESKTRMRMKILAGLVVFMFAALTTRLWFLQVLASQEFSRLADENQVRLVPIEPVRGEIVDRNGQLLVGNRATTVLVVDRAEMEGREEEVLFRLSKELGVSVKALVARLNSVKYLPYQPIPVAEDVPERAVLYIREHPDLFPGVSYRLAARRDYPHGSLAAHLLGHLGEISEAQLERRAFRRYHAGQLVGQSGVEATYERYLHGVNGIRQIQVNAQGRVLDENFASKPAKKGDTLVLSLDGDVQQLSERSLDLGIKLARQTPDEDSAAGKRLRATGGSVVVMDPSNGQVLALASLPTYDPSVFLNGLSRKELERFDAPRNNQPFFDRSLQGLYPPGSTFKPFVAGAAFKERIARPDGRYDCPGSYTVPWDASTVFHNWFPADKGLITMEEALVVSCDTVFYDFGLKFWLRYRDSGGTREVMQRHLRAMGFGRPTGIDLPGEQPGVIPTERYKRRLYESNPKVYGRYYGWLPGDNINMSIGQGYVEVTPIQLATAYAALANGGTLYKPRVALAVRGAGGKVKRKFGRARLGRLPIPKHQTIALRNFLKGVTTRGTAALAFDGFPLSQIPVAGKTGTAEIAGRQPYSWFAAIAPADRPRYVVVAMVEQGGHGSTTAAPVVRRILEGLFDLSPPEQIRSGGAAD